MPLSATTFARKLLSWFDAHGRKTLPWQSQKTPYRVWISEIMLQQTQVNTVIPYFERFMQRFSTIEALAQALEDEVLHLFAGLGYYARARALHRAARLIQQTYHGQFPDTLETIKALPGIGPSTAGAILSIAFNTRAPILDGNVKRVFTRLFGIETPINEKATEKTLWALADQYTPQTRIADYTQAIMDFGATLCTQKEPACATCPFQKKCIAYEKELVHTLPFKTKARPLPRKQSTFLVLKHENAILLEKRPATGIWGGLYSLPEMTGKASKQTLLAQYPTFKRLSTVKHTFTHYHLELYPILVEIHSDKLAKSMAKPKQIWYNLYDSPLVGLPKPIQTILRTLT